MKLLFSIIFLLLISSCRDKYDNYSYTNEYIPLQIGNEWQFTIKQYGLNVEFATLKVTDKVKINNKFYFKILFDETNVDAIPKEILIRQGEENRYYEYKDGKEYLYRSFKDGLIKNATSDGDKLVCYTRNEDFLSDIGTFYKIKSINVGEVETDGGFTEVYAEGYGLIERSWFGGSWKLKYLKVGNLVLGVKR